VDHACPLTRVVHCSDLHFGHGFIEHRAERFLHKMEEIKPDAVVVSGDLTMRARPGQFRKARAFLDKIQAPLLVIPGNHDIPVYDVATRFFAPFYNYNRFTAGLGQNPLVLPNAAFLGLNTIYKWRHQQGRVRPEDLQRAKEWLRGLPNTTWKIVVVHQHFINLPGHERPGVMHRGAEILRELADAGANAILHGHTHYNRVIMAGDFFTGISRPLWLVCVGTATSERTRGEVQANNYNLLDFSPGEFVIRQCDWNEKEGHFAECRQYKMERHTADAGAA